MSLRRAWTTAVALATLALAGCGGGGGGSGWQPPPPLAAHEVTVSAASGTRQARLACNRGVPAAACDLRIYEVMVEAFIDGDAAVGYGTGYGSSHHQGDLAGIIASLDYVKSLGANAIWITPIFRSIAGGDARLDATGYFASDYFTIDPKFGTLDQARALVDGAHARGMYVLFDGVFGHHKDNLVPHDGLMPAGGSNPVSYPGSYPYYEAVATYWIQELGIDGWRLDQAYQVPRDQWALLRAAVESASAAVTYTLHTDAGDVQAHPLGYMVAEVWSDENSITSAVYGGDASPALDSAFDFPARYRLVQTLACQEDVGSTTTPYPKNAPASHLDEVFAPFAAGGAYPDHAMPNLMLTNHDLVRFGDLLERAGVAYPQDDLYWDSHKAALSFLAAYSGPITLYYGDETGQEVPGFAARVTQDCAAAGLCDDHVSRTSGVVEGVATRAGGAPATLTPQQADLRQYTARLMAARAAHPALSAGSRQHVFSDARVYLDRKDAGTDHVLFVLNAKNGPATVHVAPAVVDGAAVLTDLLDPDLTVAAGDGGTFDLTFEGVGARLLGF